MPLRIAIPDMVSPSYFPLIAAVELGHCRDQGLDAAVELQFPVERAYRALEAGEVDYVGAAVHAALYVFEGWRGCRLLGALSQGMYWFLVVDRRVEAEPGDLQALRGLRIGAAPGPADGLRAMVRAAGLDPDADMAIGPVPGTEGAGVSFGVTAARALQDGAIDGFWANGMGAEVAVRSGSGRLLVDARRHAPAGAADYTFPALVATARRDTERPDDVAALVRAVVAAQQALRADPSAATAAAEPHFPAGELELIPELVARDAPYYDPAIRPEQLGAVNRFAGELGLLTIEPLPYEDVVSATARGVWDR